MQSNRNLYILVVSLFVLALIAGGFFLYQNRKQQPAVETKAPTVEKKELAVNQPPANLPFDLPIEPGSQILENYEAKLEGDRVQGTRKFTTKRTLPQAVKVYKDFFAKKSWTVSSEEHKTDLETLTMQRNDSRLLIVVSKDVNSGNNVVEITLTEPVRKTTGAPGTNNK